MASVMRLLSSAGATRSHMGLRDDAEHRAAVEAKRAVIEYVKFDVSKFHVFRDRLRADPARAKARAPRVRIFLAFGDFCTPERSSVCSPVAADSARAP